MHTFIPDRTPPLFGERHVVQLLPAEKGTTVSKRIDIGSVTESHGDKGSPAREELGPEGCDRQVVVPAVIQGERE